jgi:serine/threonine protein kinase
MLYWPIEARLAELKVVSPEEAKAIASLMLRCLHLNPKERASAEELLSDPYFDGVD